MNSHGSDNLGRLSDRVYGLIKEGILTGRLKPGQHLALEETARSLGVSTTPVRDAFGLLAADELVHWRPRRGAYVARLTAQTIEEAYQVREFLECCALDYVLSEGAPALAEMSGVAAQLAALPVGEDRATLRARAELEMRFHATLIRCVGNAKLSDIHASLNNIIMIGAVLAPVTAAGAAQIAAEQQALIDALNAADLEAARALLRAHLRSACAHILQHLPSNRLG